LVIVSRSIQPDIWLPKLLCRRHKSINMSYTTSVTRTAQRILAYIDSQAGPSAIQYQEEITSTLQNMHLIFPQWLIMTCPVQHKHFFYIGSNSAAVIGYEPDVFRLKQQESPASSIQEADLPDVFTCLRYCESIIVNEPPGQHTQIRCIFNYRFQHEAGHYIHVHDEKAAFRLSDGSLVYFTMLRDISHEKAFAGVKVEVYRQSSRLEKIGECVPSQAGKKLSKREQDLIVLIRQGLTTKEIAWHLNISHHTVRNIRSRMFEKYQVNNVVELLNRALPMATG